MGPSGESSMPMRMRLLLLSVVVAGVLSAVQVASAEEPGQSFVVGACSRVLLDCSDCDEGPVETLMGSFTLAPRPLGEDDGGVATYLVHDLVLTTESLDVRGRGLLVVDGGRLSFLGTLEFDEDDVMVVGGGSVSGPFPHAIHIDHLSVGDLRFDIHAAPAIFPDDDGDGVTDPDDLCPDTACGVLVDVDGCAVDQRCPCGAQADGSPWDSHRQYVRCVIGSTRGLLLAGRLDAATRMQLVKSAARSECGRSALASLSNWSQWGGY
jgi:hypothetical protein